MQMYRVEAKLHALEFRKQQVARVAMAEKEHATRVAKAARRREAINARTAQLRSEVRARGGAVVAPLRRQLKPTRSLRSRL